jgi:hypothetical protein
MRDGCDSHQHNVGRDEFEAVEHVTRRVRDRVAGEVQLWTGNKQ